MCALRERVLNRCVKLGQGPLPGCPGVRAWAGVFETGWVEEGAGGGGGEGGPGLAGCQRRTYLAAVIVPASTWPDSTGE